jgi:DNA segregation ATPase FtsK/SpoIIIE, S-DNA-T family
MAKVYTDGPDELTINTVLKSGLRCAMPKWTVLRLALARSLRIETPPDEALDRRESAAGGGEYALKELTGEGKDDGDDMTMLFCALLSEYHDQDLFADQDAFVRLLQRHVRRGLREFRSAWMESHDFHDYLYHELFGGLSQSQAYDGEDLKAKLLRALSEIGIAADIGETIPGPRLTRFMVKLRDVNDHGPLLRGLEKLAFALGLGDAGILPATTQEPKVVALDVPRAALQWHKVAASNLAKYMADLGPTARLPVYLGQDVTGNAFGFDLAEAPHLLIGGTTGSGKSVCLHAILLSLLTRFNAQQLKLVLIDPKRVELAPYAQLPHVADGILTSASDAMPVLNDLVAEMEKRETAMVQAGARDMDDVRAQALALPRIVVVVEELAELLAQSPMIEDPLIRLAQKARASGIHLVIATQRPDAKTFSGLLRSNVPSRIALTVQKSAESKIILDETGAEKLLGKGDMLVRLLGKPMTRVHGVSLGSDDIAATVNGKKGKK